MASASSIDNQIKEVKESIKKRSLAPIYLLKGEESYYIDLICREFETSLIDENAKDFNFAVTYGKDTTAEKLISLCRQYPLMTDLRLVIFKEAQIMDKEEWSKFLCYLQSPQPTTILVICFKKKYDQSGFTVSFKNAIVKSKGVVIESEKLKDNKVSNWIVKYFKSKGLAIDDPATNMLLDYLGCDLQKIANEVDKMLLNISTKKSISTDDIAEYIGISKDYNVFELQKALFTRNILKANEIITYFAQNPKENPIQMIIVVLFSSFVKLLIASEVPLQNPSTIAQVIGVNPFFVKDYVSALRYYNTNSLLKIISLFAEYDLKSKGIGTGALTNDSELMKELTYKILHV